MKHYFLFALLGALGLPQLFCSSLVMGAGAQTSNHWEAKVEADLEAMAADLVSTLKPWSVPDRSYLVDEYGAIADGLTSNTRAIQQAIDACSAAGGGTVVFAKGDYVTGTIELKSGVMLEVREGSRILASLDLADYPERLATRKTVMDTNMDMRQSLIFAEGVDKVGIRGKGCIDFRGSQKNFPGKQTIGKTPGRPFGIRILDSSNILVEDITLLNAACWMQNYLNCEDLIFQGMKVLNQANHNNDGIDLDGCRRVIVRDCFINAEDDAFCLKGCSFKPTSDILVENCTFYSTCNAFKIGTDTQGDFRRILARNLRLGGIPKDQPSHKGVYQASTGITLATVDGGDVEDILIKNCTIDRTRSPIFLRIGSRGRVMPDMPPAKIGALRRILIQDISGEDNFRQGSLITGVKEGLIKDVLLRRIHLAMEGGGSRELRYASVPEGDKGYPDAHQFLPKGLPSYGFFIRHATNVRFEETAITPTTPDARPQFHADTNTQGIFVDGLPLAQAIPLTDSERSRGTLPSGQKDWATYLAKHDLVWTKAIPAGFFNGAFLGDGVTGGMLYKDPESPEGLRLLMGRYDIIAHDRIPEIEYCVPRLFAGDILLTPVGKTIDESLRLSLWDAEARGTTTTDKGRLSWRTYVHHEFNAFVFVVTAEGGENAATLKVREQWGLSPVFAHKQLKPESMPDQLPPRPLTERRGDVTLITQQLQAPAAHAVAWTVLEPTPGTRVLIATLGAAQDAQQPHSASVSKASEEALARLAIVRELPLQKLDAKHRSWWHAYYPQSSLHLPQDPEWESFWWKQIYKFASASRDDSSFVMDTQGPWITSSSWSAVWWNLNVQLSYLPSFSANRLGTGRSLLNGLERLHRSGALAENAKPYSADSFWLGRSSDFKGHGTWGEEFGNLTWTLQLAWRHWRHTGDERTARWLFQLLKGDVNYYLHHLREAADGKLHLPATRSPEYENCMSKRELVNDANYALASLHWALATLLDLDSKLRLNDPLRARWQDTQNRLPALSTDKNGLMIGSDQAYQASHRHYSHLLALYPYHLIDPDQGALQRELFRKSVDHWVSMPEAFSGYSYTGAAALYATLGDSEKAITWLDKLLPRLEPNTLYTEGGGQVIETPFSAVESLAYLLLQSWGDTVRVFPAVPSRWTEASFRDFAAEGGFLVSAERQKGKTIWVRVYSQLGAPLKLSVADLPADLPLHLPAGASAAVQKPGTWLIQLPAGTALELGHP